MFFWSTNNPSDKSSIIQRHFSSQPLLAHGRIPACFAADTVIHLVRPLFQAGEIVVPGRFRQVDDLHCSTSSRAFLFSFFGWQRSNKFLANLDPFFEIRIPGYALGGDIDHSLQGLSRKIHLPYMPLG